MIALDAVRNVLVRARLPVQIAQADVLDHVKIRVYRAKMHVIAAQTVVIVVALVDAKVVVRVDVELIQRALIATARVHLIQHVLTVIRNVLMVVARHARMHVEIVVEEIAPQTVM